MKKYTILFAFCMLLLAGCKVQDSDKVNTQKNGFEIQQTWMLVNEQLSTKYLDALLHFNAWYSANESERPAILNKYFVGLQIAPSDNQSNTFQIVKNGKVIYTIHTGGQSLNNIGASWEYTNYDDSSRFVSNNFEYEYSLSFYTSTDIRVNVTHNVGNVLAVLIANTAENANSATLNFDLQDALTTLPTDIETQQFSLTGNGTFVIEDNDITPNATLQHIYLQYNISNPLVVEMGNYTHTPEEIANGTATNAFYCFKAGNMNITAIYPNTNTEPHHLQTRFFTHNYSYWANITFDNNNQDWEITLSK